MSPFAFHSKKSQIQILYDNYFVLSWGNVALVQEVYITILTYHVLYNGSVEVWKRDQKIIALAQCRAVWKSNGRLFLSKAQLVKLVDQHSFWEIKLMIKVSIKYMKPNGIISACIDADQHFNYNICLWTSKFYNDKICLCIL